MKDAVHISEFKDAELIGEGGFGRVVRCTYNGQSFARKILSTPDDDTVHRFRREVRATSGLSHPNIVRIVAHNLDRAPYSYVMPFYPSTLAHQAAALRRTPDELVRILHRVILGVEHAHANQFVHRDLKPENILLSEDRTPVLSDFGLVRRVGPGATDRTLSGQALGTFKYMAPEQWENAKHVDHRCDIYSIGRVFIQCFGGILGPMTQKLTVLPVSLQPLIEQCVQLDPNDRFPSIQSLRTAIELAYPSVRPVLGIDREWPSVNGYGGFWNMMARGYNFEETTRTER